MVCKKHPDVSVVYLTVLGNIAKKKCQSKLKYSLDWHFFMECQIAVIVVVY